MAATLRSQTGSTSTATSDRKGQRAAERVFHIQEDRIAAERRCVRANMRHHDEVSRVLDGLACIAVIGMIIPGTVGEDQIRLPRSNPADQVVADFEVRPQTSVGMAEHLVFGNAEAERRFGRFRLSGPGSGSGGSSWWPAPPSVTETNLTSCPKAANRAAVPAKPISQSIGMSPYAENSHSCRLTNSQ